jgi:hypothetical protein
MSAGDKRTRQEREGEGERASDEGLGGSPRRDDSDDDAWHGGAGAGSSSSSPSAGAGAAADSSSAGAASSSSSSSFSSAGAGAAAASSSSSSAAAAARAPPLFIVRPVPASASPSAFTFPQTAWHLSPFHPSSVGWTASDADFAAWASSIDGRLGTPPPSGSPQGACDAFLAQVADSIPVREMASNQVYDSDTAALAVGRVHSGQSTVPMFSTGKLRKDALQGVAEALYAANAALTAFKEKNRFSTVEDAGHRAQLKEAYLYGVTGPLDLLTLFPRLAETLMAAQEDREAGFTRYTVDVGHFALGIALRQAGLVGRAQSLVAAAFDGQAKTLEWNAMNGGTWVRGGFVDNGEDDCVYLRVHAALYGLVVALRPIKSTREFKEIGSAILVGVRDGKLGDVSYGQKGSEYTHAHHTAVRISPPFVSHSSHSPAPLLLLPLHSSRSHGEHGAGPWPRGGLRLRDVQDGTSTPG